MRMILVMAMMFAISAAAAPVKVSNEQAATKACGKDKACRARVALYFAGGQAPLPAARKSARSLAAASTGVSLACGESVTVTAAACITPPGGPPPDGGPPPSGIPPSTGEISCTGYSKTLVIPMAWVNPQRMYTSQWGGMGPNDAVVVKFHTGNGISPSNNLPKIGGAEYQSTPTARYAVLSAKPCDWDAQQWPGASASGYSVTVPFTLANANNFGYYPILNNNTDYYFNIRNLDNAACANNGICDMFIDLLKGATP